MGDKKRKNEYVVQDGDSYEKIAGMFAGDQRAYGDFLRANGYKPLRAGMTIRIPKPRRDGNYFVSDKDVSFAQGSAGANYKGPVMQRYGDYQANYKAAREAGYAGVGNSPFQGTGTNAGIAGATPQTPQGTQGVNWGPQSGAVIGTPPPPSLSGRDAAAAWQAADAAKKTAAAVAKGNQIEQGLSQQNGSATGGTPSPTLGATAGPSTAPQQMYTDPATGAVLPVRATGGSSSPQASQQVNPNPPAQMSGAQSVAQTYGTTPTAATPNTKGNLPPEVQAQHDLLFASQTVQAIAANKNVPMYLSPGQSTQLMAYAEANPQLATKLQVLYSVDPVDGSLHARGTGYTPGTPSNADPSPTAYNYSNTPPAGYSGGGNYGSGGRRRGGGGGGKGPKGYKTQDYTLRIGQ